MIEFITSPEVSIIKRDEQYILKGLSVGAATITVNSQLHNYSKEFTLTVNAKHIAVSDLTISEVTTPFYTDTTQDITIDVIPTDATNKDITLTHSENITVEKSLDVYTITALSIGDAWITAKSIDNEEIEKTINFTIEEEEVPAVELVTNIQLDGFDGNMTAFNTVTIPVIITPENATDKTFTIECSENLTVIDNNNQTITITSDDQGEGFIKLTANDASSFTVNIPITISLI